MTQARPFNNPYNNTWRKRIKILHSNLVIEHLFPSRDETLADWEVSEEFRGPRLGSDVTGVRVPAPTNWTGEGGRETGPQQLPIFHQNGRPNIPNIGHKSGECLKLLNSQKPCSLLSLSRGGAYHQSI